MFANVAQDFLSYIDGGELIIHNATFDMKFLDYELELLGLKSLTSQCSVIDSLKVARDMYPGQRNSLDALCKRLGIDNSKRTLHGALLDSEILARVYLAMTGGQDSLFGGDVVEENVIEVSQELLEAVETQDVSSDKTRVIHANAEELSAHDAFIAKFKK